MASLSKAWNHDGCMISDSWYIGAFGKWWKGGMLEAWYQDVIAHTEDEESWSLGILSIKRGTYFGNTVVCGSLFCSFFSTSQFFPFRTHLLSKEPASSLCMRTPTQVKKLLPMHMMWELLSGTTTTAPMMLQLPIMDHQCPHPTCSNTHHSLLKFSVKLQAPRHRYWTSAHGLRMLQHEVDNHCKWKHQEDASKLKLKSHTKLLEDHAKKPLRGLGFHFEPPKPDIWSQAQDRGDLGGETVGDQDD